MIVFGCKTEELKGLGNVMFQYAFVRFTARRLGVPFFFPYWFGDVIFCLKDEAERLPGYDPYRMKHDYVQAAKESGFDKGALAIEDWTVVYGYYQSERYFTDPDEVRRWFTFREEIAAPPRGKYKGVDFDRSVGLHLRYGDKITLWDRYVRPPMRFYREALSRVRRKDNVLVFSDDPDRAARVVSRLGVNPIYMEKNEHYEDLYLLSRCHDTICSNSTFSWWGAWLNPHPDKVVVCQREWSRPGYYTYKDVTCEGWIELETVRTIFGRYWFMHPLAVVWNAARGLKRWLSRRVR